jgi:hypothetical protein
VSNSAELGVTAISRTGSVTEWEVMTALLIVLPAGLASATSCPHLEKHDSS